MTARDELAALIVEQGLPAQTYETSPLVLNEAETIADAILAAGWKLDKHCPDCGGGRTRDDEPIHNFWCATDEGRAQWADDEAIT